MERVNILFPTEFSTFSAKTWQAAAAFSKKYNGHIYLLHVVEPPSGVVKFLGEFSNEKALKQAHVLMDKFLEGLDTEGVSYHKLVKIGKPVTQITQTVLELDASMIIMGTHGDSGVHEYLVGSNASQVVRSAPCPVLTMRDTGAEFDINNILLPLDLTKDTAEKVSRCVRLAEKFNASINVVSVYHPRDKADKANLQKKIEKVLPFIEQKGIKVESELIESKGSISKRLLEYAKEKESDLICIMTQQELNVKELFMGAEAVHIVNYSKIPVLSMRPKNMFGGKGGGSYMS